MSKKSFCIIGAGIVGTALAKVLSDGGYHFVGVWSRSVESAELCQKRIGKGKAFFDVRPLVKESDIVFLTVPDRSIGEICNELAAKELFRKGMIVVHTSGAKSSSELASAKKAGASVYSLHPVQSFAGVEQAIANLSNSFWGVEGMGTCESDKLVSGIISDMGGKEIQIKTEQKVLYHAAAVVASNYLVTLIDLACNLMGVVGVERKVAFNMLKPLIVGSLRNIEELGIPQALTGPISRCDITTVTEHVKEIEKVIPNASPIYKTLGRYTVLIAANKTNMSDDDVDALMKCFK